jgi:hypothetical protein
MRCRAVKRGVLSSAGLVAAPAFEASVCSTPREYSVPRAGVGNLSRGSTRLILRAGVFRVPCMSQNSQRRAGRRHVGRFPAAFGASAPPCQRWTNESNVSVRRPYTWTINIADPSYPCQIRSSLFTFCVFPELPLFGRSAKSQKDILDL